MEVPRSDTERAPAPMVRSTPGTGKVRVNPLAEHATTRQTTESVPSSKKGLNAVGWDIIQILLKNYPALDCVELFAEAASMVGSQDQILTDIWEYTQHSIPQYVLDRCLYMAADLGKESTVEVLSGFKANPNAAGQRFGSALTAASFNGTINIVKKLIAAGADINASHGWPLQAAAAGGHLAVVAELLAHGAEINRIITEGDREKHMMGGGTALQVACEAGSREVVDLLLQHGADPNLGPTGANGGTPTCPLIVASQKSAYEIFKSLIQAGATVDVLGGPERTTPLINAALSLSRAAVELLLERGANINLPDKTVGDTALIAASRKGDVEMVSCLLDHGADILPSNRRGENALQAAAFTGRETCLAVLVQHTSRILERLKRAIDGGNKAVERVVNGLEEDAVKEAEQGITATDGPEKDKPPLVTANVEETKETRQARIKIIPENDDSSKIVVIPDNDDSYKMVVTGDDDMPDYMKDTFADVDDLGIAVALPSLGLPQWFSAPSTTCPVASPSPPPSKEAASPPIQTQEITTGTVREQDMRSWTPDSGPIHGQSTPSSRSASPAITVITRKKPVPNARKRTATFSPNMSHSSGSTAEMEQGLVGIQLGDNTVPVRSQPLLSDSPQPIQSPFATPAASRSPSPPKRQTREQKPAPRRDTSSSVRQPPAYAALVAANFRSQSQPQLGLQSIVRAGHSASSSYSLRSLYSIPPASSAPVSPAMIGSGPTTPSLVSHSSSPSINTLASNPVQQRDAIKQKIEASSSSHDGLEGRVLHHLPHQHSLPSLSSAGWTMQVGNKTVEQPVVSVDTVIGSQDSRHDSKRMSVAQCQIPSGLTQLQPQTKAMALSVPKIWSPPASYDGEGWGDSPV
ncbi:Ankyrin repeat-containing domain protein [Rhypophila decipiens]